MTELLPRLYTQHQLFAIATLRQFFKTDLRGIVAILADSTDLRKVLGLRRVPSDGGVPSKPVHATLRDSTRSTEQDSP